MTDTDPAIVDEVGHDITAIVLLAAGAARIIDADDGGTARVRQSLADIERTAARIMHRLRRHAAT